MPFPGLTWQLLAIINLGSFAWPSSRISIKISTRISAFSDLCPKCFHKKVYKSKTKYDTEMKLESHTKHDKRKMTAWKKKIQQWHHTNKLRRNYICFFDLQWIWYPLDAGSRKNILYIIFNDLLSSLDTVFLLFFELRFSLRGDIAILAEKCWCQQTSGWLSTSIYIFWSYTGLYFCTNVRNMGICGPKKLRIRALFAQW